MICGEGGSTTSGVDDYHNEGRRSTEGGPRRICGGEGGLRGGRVRAGRVAIPGEGRISRTRDEVVVVDGVVVRKVSALRTPLEGRLWHDGSAMLLRIVC